MRFFAAERWSISFSISITRFLLPAQRRFCKLSVSLILLLLNHLPESFISFISFISFFIIFTMNIYVGNLSYRVKEADLQQVMEDYGTVTSCKVIMDRETGKSKGFGFVEIADDAAGARLSPNWTELNTKVVPWWLKKPDQESNDRKTKLKRNLLPKEPVKGFFYVFYVRWLFSGRTESGNAWLIFQLEVLATQHKTVTQVFLTHNFIFCQLLGSALEQNLSFEQ